MVIQTSDPIGIFDSGVGGLTVAAAVKQLLPDHPIVYFGDTAHLPYGDKSPEAILHYSKKITDFLVQHNCKIILAACNTVSAAVWDDLSSYTYARQALPVNVIDPVAEQVGRQYPDSAIGVIGTKNTIRSGAYPLKIKSIAPKARVSSLATPLLAPMIEEGFVYDDISNAIIKTYLSGRALRDIDILILGCTHYPIIRNQILEYYNYRVEVVDSAKIVASHLCTIIKSENLPGRVYSGNADKFFISDHTDYFEKIAETFFEKKIVLEKIDLWK